jgi:hypothetical protein
MFQSGNNYYINSGINSIPETNSQLEKHSQSTSVNPPSSMLSHKTNEKNGLSTIDLLKKNTNNNTKSQNINA